MNLEVFPLDFRQDGSPVDEHLYELTIDFCRQNLAIQRNLRQYNRVWVVARCEHKHVCDEICDHTRGDDKRMTPIPVEVKAIAGWGMKPDVSLYRVADPTIASQLHKKLIDRMQGYFADMGIRGQEVMVHISGTDGPEQLCPKWKEFLESVGATSADRWIVRIK